MSENIKQKSEEKKGVAGARPYRLDRPVDLVRDHILGNAEAEMTLIEYGSYASLSCRAEHDVVTGLRDRFGDNLRYIFRHKPDVDNKIAQQAAVLVEYAARTSGEFWTIHDALMKIGPSLSENDLDRIITTYELPWAEKTDIAALNAARDRVQEDQNSAYNSGAVISPTFFINNRRYEGPWDESSLSEALLGSLGHKLHTATVDFVRWGPSAGFMLLLMSVVAVFLVNSPAGSFFESFWNIPIGLQVEKTLFALPLHKWINDGLLSLFFLVVGLEIKREFTVGRLATRRTATLPIAASFGGVVVPALIYLAVVPAGHLSSGWGTTISTDTAFAVALIVMLGERVPVDLRVFLAATAIVDDLVSIVVVALFYSGGIDLSYLGASVLIVIALIALNKLGFYNPWPYGLIGIVLWFFLYQSGIHATLAGVIIALVTPTRPPANLRALNIQAQMIIRTEARYGANNLMRRGPSPRAMRMIDGIHARMESPAAKMLRSIQPWSSYIVLPLFALSNAGVSFNFTLQEGDLQLMSAIFLGLVVGKPVGIFLGSWLAERVGLAEKPEAYSWKQLFGAGVMAGMGFTMSLFIAGQAFPSKADFSAAKIAIFIASIAAGILGSLLLSLRGSKRMD